MINSSDIQGARPDFGLGGKRSTGPAETSLVNGKDLSGMHRVSPVQVAYTPLIDRPIDPTAPFPVSAKHHSDRACD